MKSFFNFFLAFLSIIFVYTRYADAGTRYRDIVFSAVNVTKNIEFGNNLKINGLNAALYLDVYQPANDSVQSRPLVICIHGGSLIGGDRIEMDLVCTNFAKRGYVAATIDYRLGIESPKGVTTILESLLRGVQDTKAAVRFFRSKAAEYGIDTTQIYLEGSSAGSMVAVHYAYWNNDEIPSDVNQVKWGDIEGTSGNPGYSTAINGIINYCGAIVDPKWIDPGELPVGNFHGLLDTVVPPDSGISGDFQIKLFGGVAISRIATQNGIYNHGAFFPEMGHGGNEDLLREFGPNFIYSMLVIGSTAPVNFTSMFLSATSLKIFRYDNYTFHTSAVDPSGNTIILPSSWIQYSCDSRIGSIQSSGIFTPADQPDSGFVYAKFNGITDSCFIKTFAIKYIAINPKFAVTDSLRTLQVSIKTYDTFSVNHDLPISMFKLSSTNPSVGTIDSTGKFTPKKSGTTNIIASFGSYSDTGVIKVESAIGTVVIDPFENVNGWSITGDNVDSLSISLTTDQKSAGSASLKVDYKVIYDPLKSTNMVYLNKDLSIYGIPDSIFLDIKSDGRNHRLYYRFTDVDSEFFRGVGKKFLNDSNAFSIINAPMTDLFPLEGASGLTYPLTLKRIEIQLAVDKVEGKTTAGSIYFDNFRLKYPGFVTGIVKKSGSVGVFSLEQNYPNPFNPSTSINFNLTKNEKIRLTVYDILGREVTTLINKDLNVGAHSVLFNATNLTSGLYFYRLQTENNSIIKKMMLLK